MEESQVSGQAARDARRIQSRGTARALPCPAPSGKVFVGRPVMGPRCLRVEFSLWRLRTPAAAPTQRRPRTFSSEQRPQQDAKKDKAQRQAPQGWLRFVVNLFFRMSPEEPKEKTNKKAKGRRAP